MKCTFRVPEQVPTIDEALRVGFNLAKQKEYLKGSPLVELGLIVWLIESFVRRLKFWFFVYLFIILKI